MSRLILKVSGVKAGSIYGTFIKVGKNSKLKSHTPIPLVSNVVYRFTCRCNTGKTYVGISSAHSVTRAREHLNLNNSKKRAIKDQLQLCKSCFKSKIKFHWSLTVFNLKLNITQKLMKFC